MKLVIEIDEEVIEHAKEHSEDSNDEWVAMRAIANGTIIPKGHGELIDREQALNECYRITVDGDVFEVVQYETLLGVPTIIEADKESEK